jgi:DNA-directed RNA polymerase specialized sigma subunit
MISAEQWETVEKKYKKLMWHIGHRIGQDAITNSIDDSYQELSIACLDAIRTFSKSTGQDFDTFFDTVAFDKYIKTCLWNKKNNQGMKIVKREPLRRQMTIDENIFDEKVINPKECFEPFGLENFDENLQEIINAIQQDGKMIKPSGRINVNRMAEYTNKPKSQIKHSIERLQKQLILDFGE